jgi:hypothetical protein
MDSGPVDQDEALGDYRNTVRNIINPKRRS